MPKELVFMTVFLAIFHFLSFKLPGSFVFFLLSVWIFCVFLLGLFILGTPSLAEPSTISSVLEAVSTICYIPSEAEVTLEANPTSAETEKLRWNRQKIHQIIIFVLWFLYPSLKFLDQYQYLGNCPPTPPLTQHQP